MGRATWVVMPVKVRRHAWAVVRRFERLTGRDYPDRYGTPWWDGCAIEDQEPSMTEVMGVQFWQWMHDGVSSGRWVADRHCSCPTESGRSRLLCAEHSQRFESAECLVHAVTLTS